MAADIKILSCKISSDYHERFFLQFISLIYFKQRSKYVSEPSLEQEYVINKPDHESNVSTHTFCNNYVMAN